MSFKSAENVAGQVSIIDGSWSEIAVRFDYAGAVQYPYMNHCNTLEHEERGMTGQFSVV